MFLFKNKNLAMRMHAYPVRLWKAAGAGVDPGVPEPDRLVPAARGYEVQLGAVVYTPTTGLY